MSRPGYEGNAISVATASVMGHPVLLSFSQVHTQSMLLRRGSKATVSFSKMLFMVHCDFENGSQN